MGEVDTDAIAEWACAGYPKRKYPAVFVGSSSGAVAHLTALAGVPWLPQTILVPVRHAGASTRTSRPARCTSWRTRVTHSWPRTLAWPCNHMPDANQDRLMIRRMGYFR